MPAVPEARRFRHAAPGEGSVLVHLRHCEGDRACLGLHHGALLLLLLLLLDLLIVLLLLQHSRGVSAHHTPAGLALVSTRCTTAAAAGQGPGHQWQAR